jgi:TonB family protein
MRPQYYGAARRDDRLAEVELNATGISPRFASYVPDELRRQGYRRLSHEAASGTSTSEWLGRGHVRLRLLPGSATMTFTPVPVPEPEPAAAPLASDAPGATGTAAPAADPGVPSDSAGIDFTDAAVAAAWTAPRRTFTPPDPVRPRLAVDAGVFGRVQVRARIDREGRVAHAEIVRGIPELDHAALAWASAVRFEPYVRDGRPRPFVILIPVAFLPAARSSATPPAP